MDFQFKKNTLIKFFLFNFFCLFAFLSFFSSPVRSETLVIATLNSAPSNEIKRLLPLSNYIVQRLQVQNFDKSKVLVEKSVPRIAKLLQEGKIDVYIGNPFTAVAMSRLSGMKFLLQTTSQGADKHPSVIFVKNNSTINKAKDLQGKKIAFEDSLSTSGYFLPKWFLTTKGLKLNPLKKISDEVKTDELGYVFSNDDLNTLFWVKKGKIDAGAVDAVTYQLQAKESLDQLKIIEKTLPLPPLLIGYRSNLAPDLVLRLKFVLLKMHETDEGRNETFHRLQLSNPDQEMGAPALGEH